MESENPKRDNAGMGTLKLRRLAAALGFLAVLPAAEFTTYLGDANPYSISQVITDAAGNTYVAGSRTFNLSGDPLRPLNGNDIYVNKVDPAGVILFSTYLGGKGNDTDNGMALDAAGNIYVAGSTTSPDFPIRNPYQSAPGPGFIAKFSPDGLQLLYSTYFPAAINAIAVDAAGNMYVTGMTNSSAFPVTAGLPHGGVTSGVPMTFGAFATKLAAAGDRIVWSTLLAGSDKNCGCCSSCFTSSRSAIGVAIAVDPAGNAYIAGNTDTLNLPSTPGAIQPTGPGAFVAKINASGSALGYLTYIGPGNLVISPNSYPANTAKAITVDAAGNAYVVGSTFDPQFPATPGAYQTVYNGPSPVDVSSLPDAFAIKLNPTGTAPVWATYIGGSAADAASAVTLDASGNLWISGTTASSDFPNAQGWSTGGEFVVELNAAGSALPYAGRYPNGTAAGAIALDSTGLLHIGGSGGILSAIAASAHPMTRVMGIANAAWGPVGGRVSPGEVISLYGPHIGPNTQVFVNGVAAPILYSSDSQINAVTPFGIDAFSTVPVRIGGGPEFIPVVLQSDPEVFQFAGGQAAAINQDGTVNGPDNPADRGSILAIWATGAGVTIPIPADGSVPTAAQNFNCCQVYSGLTPLPVVYSGAAPGIVAGVVQINFQLPADQSTDYITVVAKNRASQPVQVFVKQ
jgi:uncharacterized protein (TIGR03437 family)